MAPLPRLVSRTAAALSERRARLDALLARVSGPPAGETLHDLRVALRRAAALARLTGDVPGKGAGNALRTAARDLRRALSVRRTQDVARALLLGRFRRDPRRRPVAERLAARLAKEGDPGPSPERTRALLARLRRAFMRREAALARLHDPLTGTVDQRAEKRLAKSVRRRLGRAAKRLYGAGVPGPAGLHPARILARDLRYGLEFAGDAMPAPDALVPMLAEFQDTAGRAHDLAELIGEVRRLAGRSRAADRREALRLLPSLLGAEERAVGRAQASSRRLLARLDLSELEWS
ncbi:MAG TPA: CHAD domain-containing protein [Thermoanaerobaculia bacterium]|nr:CHAD domain-containing protein [Thermoanaerobaculia bacterium]